MVKSFINVVQDSPGAGLGIPFKTKNAPSGADKDSVLCIVHRATAVASRLIISLSKALQVCIKVAMTRKRLR